MLPISHDFALFRARRTPDKEAVIDWHAGIRYTWRDIAERSARVASLFADRMKLSPGDRVGILALLPYAHIYGCRTVALNAACVNKYNICFCFR